jgi:hypothetical protein
MDAVVTARISSALLRVALVLALTSSVAAAQSATPPSPPGGLWIVGGGSATTLLGDCTDCPADTYVHSGGVLGIVGKPLTPRTDVGFEVFWVPSSAPSTGDSIKTTYLMGTLQFRPWLSKGFFLRFSSGMALVRNWAVIEQSSTTSFTSKAFALEVGAGWEWRLAPRFGTQIFGAQHVAALGDLTGSAGTVENVMGNFWSAGAAFVIR